MQAQDIVTFHSKTLIPLVLFFLKMMYLCLCMYLYAAVSSLNSCKCHTARGQTTLHVLMCKYLLVK